MQEYEPFTVFRLNDMWYIDDGPGFRSKIPYLTTKVRRIKMISEHELKSLSKKHHARTKQAAQKILDDARNNGLSVKEQLQKLQDFRLSNCPNTVLWHVESQVFVEWEHILTEYDRLTPSMVGRVFDRYLPGLYTALLSEEDMRCEFTAEGFAEKGIQKKARLDPPNSTRD